MLICIVKSVVLFIPLLTSEAKLMSVADLCKQIINAKTHTELNWLPFAKLTNAFPGYLYERCNLPNHPPNHIRKNKKQPLCLDKSNQNLSVVFHRVHEFLASHY